MGARPLKGCIVIYLTKQEILDLITNADEKLYQHIVSHNPDLFKEEILLYVPLYEGYEVEINDQVGFYGRNSILAFEDKFIIAIDRDVDRHIHLCDYGDDHAYVLTLREDRDSKVVQVSIDIIEIPVEDKPVISFCKSFPVPINLEDEKDISQLQELWDKHYVKDLPVLNFNIESKFYS